MMERLILVWVAQGVETWWTADAATTLGGCWYVYLAKTKEYIRTGVRLIIGEW